MSTPADFIADLQNRITVQTAIGQFLELINGNCGYVPEGYVFTADEPGKRYTRIVMATGPEGRGRSVHCFIDNHTGDVLKPAGWKAPAKGVRGNIVHEFEVVENRWDWSGHWLYLR